VCTETSKHATYRVSLYSTFDDEPQLQRLSYLKFNMYATTPGIATCPRAHHQQLINSIGLLQGQPAPASTSSTSAISFKKPPKNATNSSKKAAKSAKKQAKPSLSSTQLALSKMCPVPMCRWADTALSFAERHDSVMAAVLQQWKLLDWLEVRSACVWQLRIVAIVTNSW
jgi:hypothetical protein